MAFTPAHHKPSREWPLLILAVAMVCAICIPLWQWSVHGRTDDGGWSKWTTERVQRLLLGPEQIACYCAFAWASLILISRYLEIRRQRRAFDLSLLPTEEGMCILPEDARLMQREVDEKTARGGPYILGNMIRLSLGKYAISRSGRDVSETVSTQAEVDLNRLGSGLATVQYLAWAIPAIGFLGTARGLATTLTLGGQESESKIGEFIATASSHLNVAFDTTLVALGLSLVLMFLVSSIQRDEESLVMDCQQYCLENLVTRLYDLDSDHPTREEGDAFLGPTMAPAPPRS